MKTLVIAVALILSCTDNDEPRPDAVQQSNDAPAIKWSSWGASCQRALYGAESCHNEAGDGGLCVLDWTGHDTCRHYCYSNPPYRSECPADGIAIHDGYYSQGCYCARLPL